MKADLAGDRLWAVVTATVRPFPGRVVKSAPGVAPVVTRTAPTPRTTDPLPTPPKPAVRRSSHPPAAIEPGRHRRIIRDREPPPGTIDLHGFDQDRARAALTAHILRAHAAGERTVLVVTGKGALGDGVLRRRTPEWLAEPPLRAVVAGLSEAHRRHGGEGALYVALKRRSR